MKILRKEYKDFLKKKTPGDYAGGMLATIATNLLSHFLHFVRIKKHCAPYHFKVPIVVIGYFKHPAFCIPWRAHI